MKKNNAWNITLLVNESIVLMSQGTSVSYCRLTDFRIGDHYSDGDSDTYVIFINTYHESTSSVV